MRVEPSGRISHIQEIISPNGVVSRASVGEQITITLTDDIDISRGDSIVSAVSQTLPTKRLRATLCWFDERALNPARKYLLKHTTQTVFAKVDEIHHIWDVHTLSNFC